MGKKDRLAQQIKDTETRWQHSGVRLGKLQLARELETRIEERLRLDAIITDILAQRAAVEAELDALEAQNATLPPTTPALTAPLRRVEVFWSYAHADEPLRNELAKRLEELIDPAAVRHFHDRTLQPGAERDSVIAQRIAAAHLILLLVSADYLADDRLEFQELRPALLRHQAGDAIVVPIVLRACDLTAAPFAKLVMLPKDGLPVVAWPDREMVLYSIAKQIQMLVAQLADSFSRQRP